MQKQDNITPNRNRRGFLRGGNWDNDTNAGVETLNLNNTPGNTNNNIGFRCVRYTSCFMWSDCVFYGTHGCAMMTTDVILSRKGIYVHIPIITRLFLASSYWIYFSIRGKYAPYVKCNVFVVMYEDVFSFTELYYAYCRARKLRRQKRCVVRYEQHLECNLEHLSYVLRTRTYRHGAYREFIVRDSKKRLIRAAPFCDRIVHHALCKHIEPLFEKRFIFDSYVCRKNKGTHRAIRRLKKFMYGVSNGYTRRAYFLKLDISKYFQSIDHEILYALLTRVIDDVDIRDLLRLIIDSSYDSNKGGRKKGIPIGNLTSQLFANIYLNELDHYVKEKLYCRYYIRYMDDIVICSDDKQQLHIVRSAIEIFLQEHLCLIIHPHKVFIAPITTGIPFLGYVLFPHVIRLRTATIQRCKRRIQKYNVQLLRGKITTQKIKTSRASWYGYAKHANAWHISENIWKKSSGIFMS